MPRILSHPNCIASPHTNTNTITITITITITTTTTTTTTTTPELLTTYHFVIAPPVVFISYRGTNSPRGL
ncbi:hypothetical protein [uncultured Thiodictyon sp.]|uniref:hypothetical protein n=1 Tax=uncultured Thiodictyon sp. TaxID=1846217 RepID=UPI0025DA7485|nr:hypothetical protein [uncultured Thiodictyon sp.]